MASSAPAPSKSAEDNTTKSHIGISEPATVIKPARCYFLDVAPPEIRNRIYNLVFTSDKHEDCVELKDRTPPPKALLLTCKKVCAEAKGMHRAAHREFWSERHCKITQLPGVNEQEYWEEYCHYVETRVRSQDLAHIAKLTIALEEAGIEWTFIKGEWRSQLFDPPRPGVYFVLVPSDKVEVVREAGFNLRDFPLSDTWKCNPTTFAKEDDYKDLNRLLGKTTLTSEELVAFLTALQAE